MKDLTTIYCEVTLALTTLYSDDTAVKAADLLVSKENLLQVQRLVNQNLPEFEFLEELKILESLNK